MKTQTFAIGRNDLGQALFLKREGGRFTLIRKGAAPGGEDAAIQLSVDDVLGVASAVASCN